MNATNINSIAIIFLALAVIITSSQCHKCNCERAKLEQQLIELMEPIE